MSLVVRLLSTLRKITVVIAIAIAFLFGVGTTVYLSLRSPEVKVPDIVGKDRFEAEKILANADLNFRVRATRPSNQSKPDVVLFQLPRAGEVVKTGQTVAMDISRVAKEGETPETVKTADEPTDNQNAGLNSNTNENKPKRNRNINKNANENENNNPNINGTRAGNTNRPINSNRANANANVSPRANVNHLEPANSNVRPVEQNENRRPATARPTPSATRSPAASRTPDFE